jgi:hypothetical protein
MRVESRRHFLALVAGALPVLSWRGRAQAWSSGRLPAHPEPRPGIDASRVTPRDRVADPNAVPVFDMVREMPQIVDGIRCQCGCAEVPDNYSLLSCYEGDGMAAHCEVCKGQAKLAYRQYKQGKSLNQIRAAIDAEFGG